MAGAKKAGPPCPDCGEVQPSYSALLGPHKQVCSAKKSEGEAAPPAPTAPAAAEAATAEKATKPERVVGRLPTTMVVPVLDSDASRKALEQARKAWAKNRPEDALRLSREAVQFDPRSAEALAFRALLLNEKKQFEEARAVARQSLEAEKSAAGWLALATAELYLGQPTECLEACAEGERLEKSKQLRAVQALARTAIETGVMPKPKEGTKMDRAEAKKAQGRSKVERAEEKRLAKEQKEAARRELQRQSEEQRAKAEEQRAQEERRAAEEKREAAARREQERLQAEERRRKEAEEKKEAERRAAEEKKEADRRAAEEKLHKAGKGAPCTDCKKFIPRGKKFCLDCGALAPLPPMKPPKACTACGTKLVPGKPFCGDCGMAVREMVAPPKDCTQCRARLIKGNKVGG